MTRVDFGSVTPFVLVESPVRFAFTAGFTTARSGLGALVAFQLSAESGDRRDVYEVPVRMT